jgi:hypothetical protein
MRVSPIGHQNIPSIGMLWMLDQKEICLVRSLIVYFNFFEFIIQVIWRMLFEIELIFNLVFIIQCTNGFIHCI